jgi:aminoglycoside 3-N-acetyltransferase
MLKSNYKDLKELFTYLGVKKSEIVMMHGFMPSLGRIDGGYKTLFNVLFDLVGDDGGVIIPTFTYSYTKGEIYDVNNTKSTVGDFTNYFLTLDGVYRNLEPNFSMAGMGKNIQKVIFRDKKLTFGKNSIYQKIEDKDILFLLIGIGWDQGLSYFMHLEASYGVKYRYNKVFKGETIGENGKLIKDEATHFVRDYDANPIQYRSRIGKYLESNNIAKVKKYRYGVHKSIKAKKLKEEVFRKLDFNKYYLLKEVNNKET